MRELRVDLKGPHTSIPLYNVWTANLTCQVRFALKTKSTIECGGAHLLDGHLLALQDLDLGVEL